MSWAYKGMRGMRLETLIRDLGLRHHAGPRDVSLIEISDDSRAVPTGAVYIARGGSDSRKAYIKQAVERGAAAVISEPLDGYNLPDDIAWYCHDQVDQRQAGRLAERFFGEPANRLSLIGITGTNGKTTASILIQHLLQHAGVQTGVIGTIHTDDGTEAGRRTASLTTPGAIEFSRELARMADAGCQTVVAEVSSHALEQGRTSALTFRTAIFTNLTQDHLDYHKTMEAYAKAKSILFTQLAGSGHAIINADDPHAKQVLAGRNGPVWWTSLADTVNTERQTVCYAKEIELHADSSSARFIGPWGDVVARLPLVGKHNVCNALQAIAAAHSIVDLSGSLREGLESIPQVPGRLERVPYPEHADGNKPAAIEPPAILVDYAHTPDALENALTSLRPVTPGKLIVMFGCGGDRDQSKRPIMAQAACSHADTIFLTSDNPRTEDPQAIINDAITGVPTDKRGDLTVIVDRAQAIQASVLSADAGDTVLLAGKGHEDYQTIGKNNIHFDDREHAAQALMKWAQQKAASP
jgi:UDP-N-acetylmuramoyl-L-alanyl-D-glutamate--2,6-diaminopimelate ligase